MWNRRLRLPINYIVVLVIGLLLATCNKDSKQATNNPTATAASQYCGRDLVNGEVKITNPTYSAVRNLRDTLHLVVFDTKNSINCKFSKKNIDKARLEYFGLVYFDPSSNPLPAGGAFGPKPDITPDRLRLIGPSVSNELLPNDVESICILPGNYGTDKFRFLATESLSFKDTDGDKAPDLDNDRIFLVEADLQQKTTTVLHAVRYGKALRATTYQHKGRVDIEGMLCETTDDKIIITLGDRGEANSVARFGATRPSALIRFDVPFTNDKFCNDAAVREDCVIFRWVRTLIAPLPSKWAQITPGKKDSARYISDLLPMSDGSILASSSYELDAGGQGGTIWKLCSNTTDCNNLLAPTSLTSSPTSLVNNVSIQIVDEKVEGISAWGSIQNSVVTVSDNETEGRVFLASKPQ